MKIKFCPKCGGIEIEDVTETAQEKMLYHYGSPRLYKCKECEFVNTFFPEADKEKIEKIKKKLRKLIKNRT